jgi:hypothetical protein
VGFWSITQFEFLTQNKERVSAAKLNQPEGTTGCQMVEALNREDREALIAQLEDLKRGRYDSDPSLNEVLDAEIRMRFGAIIYRALASSRHV